MAAQLGAAHPLAALIALVLAIGAAEPSFLSAYSLGVLARESSVILLLAIGQTMIVILGRIDLSMAALASLTSVLIASFLPKIIGIFILDLEGRIIEANDAFLHIVGYDREDLVSGRIRWVDLTPPEWLDRDKRRWVPELKPAGILPPFEMEYFRKDGSRVPALIGAATFDESANQGVAFVLDLTALPRSADGVGAREPCRDHGPAHGIDRS